MAKLLLKLLGIEAANGGTIVDPHIALRGPVPVAVLILIGLIVAALAVWLYRREDENVGGFRRWTMAVLRIAFLAILLLLIARPVLSFTTENTVRRGLVVIGDTSGSMAIKDPRTDVADQVRAAIALGILDPVKGLTQTVPADDAPKVASIARIDVLKSIFANKNLDLLNRLAGDYDLKLYAFQDSIDGRSAGAAPLPASAPATTQPASTDGPVGWLNKLQPWAPITPIGDELRRAIARTRGQPLAGILLLTDGGNNAGSDPLMAAKAARQEGVPIYTYGVGISSPKDIVVADLFAKSDVVFAKDEVPIGVRVKGQNLKGESAQIVLTLGGERVDTKPITFAKDQDEQVIEMKFTPQRKGEFELVASIPPRSDEAESRNNSKQRHIKVVDDKIKVLLVDQGPRWEFKYLMQQMLRDRRVHLKVFLVEGDPGITKGDKTPYIAEFPRGKSDLNDKFDVVILGDVDPKVFSQEQLKNLSDFVSIAGGGLIMIAGRQFAPNSYANTPLDKMLPVEIDTTRAFMATGPNADVSEKPIRMELTPRGARNGMLRLSDKEDESIRRWRELPPIYWTARVARAKPAAEALLVDADPAKAIRGEKMPIVALQQYGLGQVIFVGTDNTWRWRRNKGDEFYITLWGQMIQRIALPHLLGSKRTQLSADKEQYNIGERVTIYARLYDATYEPVAEPTVKGSYIGGPADAASPTEREVILRPVPEQRGMYKGEFLAPPAAGNYKFFVEKPGEPDVKLDFAVAESTVEFGDTAMNESLLRDISIISGGEFFREETLYKLPDAIRLKTDRIGWPVEIELWSTWLFFLIALAVVTAEWVLRKTAQLK
jgi:hypothetical protein